MTKKTYTKQELIDSFEISYWLKALIQSGDSRDVVDVLNDLEIANNYFKSKLGANL